MTVSGLNYSTSSASSFTGKKYGKVSMLNGDGSIITTGTIVPVPVMQYFGRNRPVTTLQIKSNDDVKKFKKQLMPPLPLLQLHAPPFEEEPLRAALNANGSNSITKISFHHFI